MLAFRSRVLRSVRNFFHDRDFLEVETPVRIDAPALEEHIDAEQSGDMYLRTSPELYMKRLVAAGCERVFEMGPCFRRGELGALHNPEYTMLEWYRTDADYSVVLDDTRDLLQWVAEDVTGCTTITRHGIEVDLANGWEIMTISEAFTAKAGWDPLLNFDADRFDIDLVNRVEPALPVDRPVVLKEYPAPLAALARLKPGSPGVAERWELYVGGIELANAYSELTDAVEQRRRFEDCASKRMAAGKQVYPVDEKFMAALETGLPDCAGVALGIDRLVMLLSGAVSIGEVRAFCCTDDGVGATLVAN